MIDDSEGNAELVEMTSTTVLATLHVLIECSQIKDGSSNIRSIRLVFSHSIKYGSIIDNTYELNENGGINAFVKLVDNHNVII